MADVTYTREEMMAVAISREIKDGDRVAVGTISPVAAAGVILAHEHHAPSSELFIWLVPHYWPFTEGMKEFFDRAQQGGFDVFFLGGAQVDAIGNTNLVAIGSYDRPTVRLPGGAASGTLSYTVPRIIVFLNDHSRRTLVERVDFITVANRPPAETFRRGEVGRCITPLSVLDFSGGQAKLVSLHPGVALEQVVENTSFPLILPAEIPVTPAPTPEELGILRGKVKAELVTIYPQFCRQLGEA